MSMRITIEPNIITFNKAKLLKWKNDNGNSTNGFGENEVKEYLEAEGYKCIQHDFNILGGNVDGKYPEGEEILRKYFGEEKYNAARKLMSVMYPFRDIAKDPFEEPDMLVYKPDFSEFKFVEVKRDDTGDRLRKKQVRGLLLLACFLNVDIDVYILVSKDKKYNTKPIVWEFPTHIVD